MAKPTVEEMVKWFYDHYEDPVEGTPYCSAEGGYQWWGGPYYADMELAMQFGDGTEDTAALIAQAVQQIRQERDVWEWQSKSDLYGDDSDSNDEPDFDPPDPDPEDDYQPLQTGLSSYPLIRDGVAGLYDARVLWANEERQRLSDLQSLCIRVIVSSDHEPGEL